MRFIIIMGIVFLFLLTAVSAEWTIKDDKVFINDTQAYISAQPHTLRGNGYVYIDILSKIYSGEVNAVFGFDTDNIQPQSLEVYTGTETEIINGTEVERENWETLQYDKHIQHDYNNKSDWYVFTGRNINAGQLYNLRMKLQIPRGSKGKYDFAIYPSSYGSNIQQAINDGNIYILDPWYEDEEDLELYYDLDNLTDLSGKGNDGTNYGTTTSFSYPTFNVEGNSSPDSSYFEESDEIISYVSMTDDFTASLWFNTSDKGGFRYFLINDKFYLRIRDDEGLQARIYDDEGYVDMRNTTITGSDGDWHNILIVKDGNNAELWYDGSIIDSADASSLDSYTGDFTTTLGQGYLGLIDEVMIINRALNSTERQNINDYGNPEGEIVNTAPNITDYSPENTTINLNNVTFPYDIVFSINYTDEENDSTVLWSTGEVNTTEIVVTYDENTTENVTVNVSDADYHDNVTWNVNITGTEEEIEGINPNAIDLRDTQYGADEEGKLFIQLLDESYRPIRDALCYVSLWYPIGENTLFKDQQMSYLDEGLYYYNFQTPYRNGIYPASAFCVVETTDIDVIKVLEDFESGGVSGGSGWNDDWTLNGAVIDDGESYEGNYSLLSEGNDNPERSISTSDDYNSITVNLQWWAHKLETDDVFYIYLDDTEGNSYMVQEITHNFDDRVWREVSKTFNDVFEFDGDVTLRVESENAGNNDFIRIDDIEITLTEEIENDYQIVRGSGEVQIRSDKLYTDEFTGGELYNDTFFEYFHMHYDIESRTAQNVSNQDITVETYYGFPCRYVNRVNLYDEDHNIIESNLTPLIKEEYNSNKCQVTFPLDLEPDKTYDIAIVAENFWKQQVISDYQDAVLTKDYLDIACINYKEANNLSDYDVPLDDIPEYEGEFHRACYNFYNSFYEYNKTLNETFLPLLYIESNFSAKEMDLLEADLIHLRRAGEDTRIYGDTIIQGLNLGNSYSQIILNDPYPPENPHYTEYFSNISSSYINYKQMLNVTSQVEDQTTTFIGGTEYETGEEGQLAIRLVRNNGAEETGADCTANILYPNETYYKTAVSMSEFGDGVYTYNFTVPDVEGVYVYYTDCNKSGRDYRALNTFHVAPWANRIINQTELSNSLFDYLQDINNTVTTIDGRTVEIGNNLSDLDEKVVSMNGTLTSVYDLLVEMNQTITEVYTLADSINATVVSIQGTVENIETIVLDIQGTIVQINETTISINNTVNTIDTKVDDIQQDILYLNNSINTIQSSIIDINGTVVTMDGKIDSIQDAVININGTVNNIENVTLDINGTVTDVENDVGVIDDKVDNITDAVVTINSTLNNVNETNNQIYDAVLTINGTVNGIENTVLVIDGKVTTIEGLAVDINQTVYRIEDYVLEMNGTVTNIEDNTIAINSTANDIKSLVQEINGTTHDNYELLLQVNGSLNDLDVDIGDLNQTLQDIYNLELTINDTVYDIYNLSQYMNITINDIEQVVNDTYNLTITINGTVNSYLSEFEFIKELINNQTAWLEIALANVSYFNESEYNASDYYVNATVVSDEIHEEEDAVFRITTLQDPIEGNHYNLIYYISQGGVVEEQFSIQVEGNDTITFPVSIEELGPISGKETFDVHLRVEMLNGDGLWQSFPLEYVDDFKVRELTKRNTESEETTPLTGAVIGVTQEPWFQETFYEFEYSRDELENGTIIGKSLKVTNGGVIFILFLILLIATIIILERRRKRKRRRGKYSGNT